MSAGVLSVEITTLLLYGMSAVLAWRNFTEFSALPFSLYYYSVCPDKQTNDELGLPSRAIPPYTFILHITQGLCLVYIFLYQH